MALFLMASGTWPACAPGMGGSSLHTTTQANSVQLPKAGLLLGQMASMAQSSGRSRWPLVLLIRGLLCEWTACQYNKARRRGKTGLELLTGILLGYGLHRTLL